MSRHVALWVVGEPGVGKTTLVRRLIEPGSKRSLKPKWTIGKAIVAAGHYVGGKFDGADTVPYNGAAEALEFWRIELLPKMQLTIFDGDRFSNAKSVGFVAVQSALPVQAACAHLVLPEADAAARRAARGGKQSETWVRGRKTKAARFAETFEKRIELDARHPTAQLEAILRGFLADLGVP